MSAIPLYLKGESVEKKNSVELNELVLRVNSADRFNCVLIGEGQRADAVWTKKQYLNLCTYMLNGNSSTEFLNVYRDAQNRPKFTKAKKTRADRRAAWTWDTIRGVGRSKVGIGFYPTNSQRRTRWGAMDFDSHDGDPAQARQLAIAAFETLKRHSRLDVILASSGSCGWHLFAFARDFYPIEQWTLLLKRVAASIGTEVQPGLCEIFPNEVQDDSWPYAIRAPGTWNPKTDELGFIFFSSVGPLQLGIERGEKASKKEKKNSPFIYHSTHSEDADELNDSGEGLFYTGGHETWLQRFAITQTGTRHAQLRALVHTIFRQVGRRIARENAKTQHKMANPSPHATLAEHLEEFEELWSWTESRWRGELSAGELELYESLDTDLQRDLFRILKNFARYAASRGDKDFAFPIEHVGKRTGVSAQYMSQLRKRFIELGIIAQTASAVTNRFAAKFRWSLPFLIAGPALMHSSSEDDDWPPGGKEAAFALWGASFPPPKYFHDLIPPHQRAVLDQIRKMMPEC